MRVEITRLRPWRDFSDSWGNNTPNQEIGKYDYTVLFKWHIKSRIACVPTQDNENIESYNAKRHIICQNKSGLYWTQEGRPMTNMPVCQLWLLWRGFLVAVVLFILHLVLTKWTAYMAEKKTSNRFRSHDIDVIQWRTSLYKNPKILNSRWITFAYWHAMSRQSYVFLLK